VLATHLHFSDAVGQIGAIRLAESPRQSKDALKTHPAFLLTPVFCDVPFLSTAT
jgi:hypothetical protein